MSKGERRESKRGKRERERERKEKETEREGAREKKGT